jgi:hypothetical protein
VRPSTPGEGTPRPESLTEKIARLEAELASAREAQESESVATRARPRVATASSSTGSTSLKEGATATERWSHEDLQANLSGAPGFRIEDRVDDERLTLICEAYTAVTGDPVRIPKNHPPKKRNLIAAAYRVHGDDFIPFVRAVFLERGTATNLLGIVRSSPPRADRSTVAPAALSAEPAPPERSIAVQHSGDSSSSHIERLSDEELREETADLDRRLRGQSPASVDPEVAWRVAAMRPQYLDHGPIGFLRARPDKLFDHDVCVSCGGPLSDKRPRCGPCVEAVNIVVGEHP